MLFSSRAKSCCSACIAVLLFIAATAAEADAAEGSLQVSCEPGVRVFLDDHYIGETTEWDGGLFLPKVGEGLHTLKAVKKGCLPFFTLIRVSAGLPTEVRVTKAWEAWPGKGKTGKASSRTTPVKKDCSRARTIEGPPCRKARRPIRLFLSSVLPIVPRVTEQWSESFWGFGIEGGIPLAKPVSLSALFMNAYHSFGDTDSCWFAFDAGLKLEFGMPKAHFLFRPGIVYSSVKGLYENVEYDCAGAGVSLAFGPEFRPSPSIGFGILFGMHYLLMPYEGREQHYIWQQASTGGTMAVSWSDETSRRSFYFNFYLMFSI